MPTWDQCELVEQLETDLQQLLRYRVQNLRIDWSEGSLVLLGRAMSYYDKQMAQEHVLRRSPYPLGFNRITV